MKIKKIPIFCMGELDSIPVEKPEEFWQGRVLSQGSRVLIAGARKSHKSDFFIELAVRAASEGVFLGKKFSRPLRILYIQSEIKKSYLKERIAMFTQGCDAKSLSLVHENLFVTDRVKFNINTDKGWKELYCAIESIKPDIVALDPIISFTDFDENSAQQVSAFLYGRLGRLQETLTPVPTLVLIHHFKKIIEQNDSDDIFLGIRGSSAWLGWYDTGIVLKKGKDAVTLHYETRDCQAPSTQAIKLHREKGSWVIIDKLTSTSNDKIYSGVEIIRSSIRQLNSGELKIALMKKLGIQERHAYHIIKEIKKHSNIFVHEEGRKVFFSFKERGVGNAL